MSDSREEATILVVDDIESNRQLARDCLEVEGYRVVEAASGKEGLAAFARERPDCVLLDVRMPEVDGVAVCEKIRTMPGGAETPVIFLTALRDVDTFDRALHAGGDDFLTKPVRASELAVRVQTALKLRKLRVELREHYDLLKRQRDDSQRLQLQKERLTAFVVHDLKNPVAAMDLHAQAILHSKDVPEEARSSATRIRRDARQLSRMILNLLDLSKADEGQLAPKLADVVVAPLVESVITELEPIAASLQVTLTTELAVARIYADADLLHRVLTNLTENAIRHAPRGSAVTIAIAANPDTISIRVIDRGAGIPVDMREKIFSPFVQIDASGGGPASRGGRGLGLAFCRAAIEAHGGSVHVEDGAPGSIFRVELPLRTT